MIKDVKVIDGCISCRNCENVCPKIFKVNPKSKVISRNFEENQTEILIAEATCPVNVIKVDKKDGVSLNFKKSKVLSKKYLTEDIVELILERPEKFDLKPGQYVSIMFEDWKGKFSRQYSIAFLNDNSFGLTIRLAEKGRGSNQIAKLKEGKILEFLGPIGNFYLQNNKKDKYFISTGTGLAPFMAMGQKLSSDVKKYFIIGARKQKDLFYQEKLKEIENSEVHYFLSREEKTGYNKGRVTNFLEKIPKENSEVYICGNPDMVDSVFSNLKEKGYKDENIFKEGFTSSGRKNRNVFYEIFKNGNIPFVKQISWGVIFLGFLISAIFIYRIGNGISLFKNFLIFGNFQNFVFNLSWFSLAFVMIIRPLSDIFSKNDFLRKLKNFRKSFGILSSILIFTNLVGPWLFDINSMISYFTTPGRWNNFMGLIARSSEITAFILLITSNNFSQKFLGKNWKRVQYLSYIYIISGAIIGATNGAGYFKYYGILAIWIIFYFIAFFINKRKKDIL